MAQDFDDPVVFMDCWTKAQRYSPTHFDIAQSNIHDLSDYVKSRIDTVAGEESRKRGRGGEEEGEGPRSKRRREDYSSGEEESSDEEDDGLSAES